MSGTNHQSKKEKDKERVAAYMFGAIQTDGTQSRERSDETEEVLRDTSARLHSELLAEGFSPEQLAQIEV